MNEIKIDGKICSQKAITTSNGKVITNFSLNIYNGKKDGKSVYDFVDCKHFGSINIPDKTKVIVNGWVGVESWVKDGKTNKRIVVYAKEVIRDISVGTAKKEVVCSDDVLCDGIPF